jgi:uncharacterized small protein (DUF1192 family)
LACALQQFALTLVEHISAKDTNMAIDPEELLPKKKRAGIVLGEDLSEMSAPELELRISELETEIARCKEAITQRNATKSAAATFFKR